MNRLITGLSIVGTVVTLAATPGLVKAQPIVTIDDILDAATINSTGFDPATYQAHNNGTESPGLHGQWISADVPPAPGTSVTYTIALCEPNKHGTGPNTCDFPGGTPSSTTIVSDFLNITFTGEQPNPADPNNVSVDLTFASDLTEASIDGVHIDGGVFETGGFQNFTTDPNLLSGRTGVPTDFVLLARSDVEVPEPSTLALLGSSLLGLPGYAWRRRKLAAVKA